MGSSTSDDVPWLGWGRGGGTVIESASSHHVDRYWEVEAVYWTDWVPVRNDPVLQYGTAPSMVGLSSHTPKGSQHRLYITILLGRCCGLKLGTDSDCETGKFCGETNSNMQIICSSEGFPGNGRLK